MRKTGYILIASMLLLQTGCQNITKEEIVVRKNVMEATKTIDGALEGDVSEQVKIKNGARIQEAIDSNTALFDVRVDAEVTVPQAEGIRLKYAETRMFETKDLAVIQQALWNGKPLWKRIFTKEQKDNNIVYTKKEAKEMMEYFYQIGEKEKGAYWEQYVATSPNEFETENVPLQIHYESPKSVPQEEQTEYAEEQMALGNIQMDLGNMTEAKEYTEWNEKNSLVGAVNIQGTGYNFGVVNNWQENYKKVFMSMTKGPYQGHLNALDLYSLKKEEMYDEKNGKKEKEGDTLISANSTHRKQAEEILQNLGRKDLQCAKIGMEAERFNLEKETHESAVLIPMEKVIDGIPVTEIYDRALVDSKLESKQDYSERMHMVFNGESLEEFYWENPCEVYDISDEYVFLLPFSQIWKIFQDRIVDLSMEEYSFCDTGEIHIKEIKLGYMWIPVTSHGSNKEGMYIPVWDFIGGCNFSFYNSEDSLDGKDVNIGQRWFRFPTENYSFLTINAMDGSIVYAPQKITEEDYDMYQG